MSRSKLSFFASAIPAILLLSACASVEGDFPSLSKRPYEQDNPVEEPAVTPGPVTTEMSAELRAKTDSLVARSNTAQAAFDAALPTARSAAQSASGAASGSESWVHAHMIVSRADGARADSVAALGEIDRLIATERDKGADSGLIGLLSTPQGMIANQVKAQNDEIERLSRLIGI